MAELYRQSSRAAPVTLCGTHPACISARLAGIGVQYAHVALPHVAFDADAGHDEIISSYIRPLDPLLSRMSSVEFDVASIPPSHPERAGIARELMIEHSHDVAEAQLLVHGGGVLFMRARTQVLALACEAGDFARVPAGLAHWFAMDAEREFRAIRLFENRNTRKTGRRDGPMRRHDRHAAARLAQRSPMRS